MPVNAQGVCAYDEMRDAGPGHSGHKARPGLIKSRSNLMMMLVLVMMGRRLGLVSVGRIKQVDVLFRDRFRWLCLVVTSELKIVSTSESFLSLNQPQNQKQVDMAVLSLAQMEKSASQP